MSARPQSSMSVRSRPRRPPSTRPPTAASTHSESYIIALYESRGIGKEVGIACLNQNNNHVTLLQISDTHSYVKTLHHIHVHYPSTLLVLDTSLPSEASSARQASVLVQYLEDEFPDVALESVMRKYWNDTAGLGFISQLLVEDEDRASTILSVTKESFSLCAVSALFKYVQTRLSTTFAPKSLQIRWKTFEGTMLIDHETAKNLELCGSNSSRRSKKSLFGLLDHVFTPMGSRLLRSTILAPTIIQRSIDMRLDAVEEIVQSEDIYNALKAALKTTDKADIDKLIVSIVTQSPDQQTDNPTDASRHVVTLLQLRNVVRCIPAIQAALGGANSQMLRTVHTLLQDERLSQIEALLADGINDDAGTGKRTGIAATNNKVYAVKANFNRMLDVARETFKENVGDIQELCASLSEEHTLSLSLVYNERGGGFWFTLNKDDLDGELPRGFLNVKSKGAKLTFTSLELKKRNARMKDALEETLMLSDRVIQDMVADITGNISVLYKASEAIAVLDMLWAFGHASIMHNYVRPEFTGTLAIKGGRHPILENIQSAGVFVANDAYACATSTFQIVQGPNMSGKSTYIRQLGLLTIMATCGCFVPAEYASFKLHDALLSRLSNDDDPERNLSTFSNEMASSAMILSTATKDSLILVDELGRGTSTIEGLGIAHAIAERLIDLRAYCFFTTHFTDLSMTLSRRSTVVNLHLAVKNHIQSSSSRFGLQFQYRLLDGQGEVIPHYGLELAKLADLPEDVMTTSRRVAEQLAQLDEEKQAASKTTQAVARRKAILHLRTQLTQAYQHSTLPDEELANYLSGLQKELVSVLGSALEG